MIRRSAALAAVAVAFACTAQAPAPSGERILALAKAAFRAHERPPFIVYTVTRRDEAHGIPSFAESYDLKIWCRTSDRNALLRHLWRGSATGPMENVTVAFDGRVDPGPPTADVFERALFAPAPEPGEMPRADATALPTIGSARVVAELDYRVRRTTREGDAWHLALTPKRDAQRNRIDDLWVNTTSYEIERMRVRDHLYLGVSDAVDDEFDVRFAVRGGLPVIDSIRGATDDGAYRTRYTYRIDSFPATLPAWYFEPRSYGSHRADAPA